MTAAIYLRVSTADQNPENQRAACERVCAARGWTARAFVEVQSAVKVRPVLGQVLEAARRGEVGAVVVWALDRLERSMVRTIQTVLEMDRFGVEVVSVRDAWLDTRGPVRALLLAIFGWVAEQERVRLGERTREGLARARASGQRLGRPPGPSVDARAVASLRVRGRSWFQVAREMGISASAARRSVSPGAKKGAPAGPIGSDGGGRRRGARR